MIYLSGTYSQILPEYRQQFGYMLNVNRPMGGEREAMQYPWMLDNGAYSDKWQERIWLARLENLAIDIRHCLGAVVPDVVGNHTATLERWRTYAPIVKGFGYKAAFATQDGATVDAIPWSDIDLLFIGGTDDHKRKHAWPLLDEAKRRGLWVHVGRVNSADGIIRFCMAHSVDGTHLKFESGRRRIENILWAVKRCNARKCRQGQLFMPESLPQPML